MDTGLPMVRPMEESGLEAGLRLSREAGWNQRIDDWRLFHGMNPRGCFVAVKDGHVIGTVAGACFSGCLGRIAMLLVDEKFRRQGIAAALLGAVLESFPASACPKLDATALGRTLYEKMGFIEERSFVRLAGAAPQSTAALPSGVRVARDGDMAGILALDAEASGVDRAPLITGFRRLAPEYALVAESGDRPGSSLEGFCLVRHGARAEHAGPLIARDPGIARKLAAAAFGLAAGNTVYLDAPLDRLEWVDWLRQTWGLAEQRVLIRMYRGSNTIVERPAMTFAISGPEFG